MHRYDRDFDGTLTDGVTRGADPMARGRSMQQTWASLPSAQSSMRHSSSAFFLRDPPAAAPPPQKHTRHGKQQQQQQQRSTAGQTSARLYRPHTWTHDSQTRGFFPHFAERFASAVPPA